ncbi:MAG: Na+/H+ antiporter subunit E [Candidatus Cloacimonadaceae bacterium]|nr:Na+/H+ antiporter subunit E [Candidatus Cloacimonadaceae bacterium]MDP3114351.1 Na+/H+ antiporter subunit E [Candidatus Cloacimonadaceae bacterium]
MQKLKAFLISAIILFGLWLLLGGLSRDEVLIGAIVSVLVTLIFLSRISFLSEIRLNPKSVIFIPIYLFVFLIELIKSTIDVARRVVSPSLPINPGIVKVKTKLKSPLGRIVLANSITLTPGTMTVETEGEDFYIHWIDIRTDDIDGATKAIVSKFEKYLEVIFG